MKKALLLFLALTLPAALGAGATPVSPTEGYSVKEQMNSLEVTTPYGKKTLVFDPTVAPTGDYRIEIPLASIKPPEPPPAPETDADGAEEDDDDSDTKSDDKTAAVPPTPAPATAAAVPPVPAAPPFDRRAEYVTRANHFYNESKFFEATEVIEQLVKEYPEYVTGWTMYGSVLYVQGRKELAKSTWKKALSLDPNNAELKSILARYP